MEDLFIREAVRLHYAKDYRDARLLHDRMRLLFPNAASEQELLDLVIQLRK